MLDGVESRRLGNPPRDVGDPATNRPARPMGKAKTRLPEEPSRQVEPARRTPFREIRRSRPGKKPHDGETPRTIDQPARWGRQKPARQAEPAWNGLKSAPEARKMPQEKRKQPHPSKILSQARRAPAGRKPAHHRMRIFLREQKTAPMGARTRPGTRLNGLVFK